jgi:nudix-type nucleoside diphosphatase (YffH/AdpP family)
MSLKFSKIDAGNPLKLYLNPTDLPARLPQGACCRLRPALWMARAIGFRSLSSGVIQAGIVTLDCRSAGEGRMPGSRDVEIRGQKRLLDDVFKVDELIVSHRQNNGEMSADQRRLIFERGDAAAVFLFDSGNRSVVTVTQFRAPTLGKGLDRGWMTEAVAGIVDPYETPEIAAVRECLEETGYKIRELKPVARFFVSPGGTSERIFLYYAEVHDADKVAAGGGLDDEDIKISNIPIDELFDMVESQRIEDPKLLIGALWLRDELRKKRGA